MVGVLCVLLQDWEGGPCGSYIPVLLHYYEHKQRCGILHGRTIRTRRRLQGRGLLGAFPPGSAHRGRILKVWEGFLRQAKHLVMCAVAIMEQRSSYWVVPLMVAIGYTTTTRTTHAQRICVSLFTVLMIFRNVLMLHSPRFHPWRPMVIMAFGTPQYRPRPPKARHPHQNPL